jgi:anaerobic glycerol-3-phosphate dehydrogenase
MGYKTALISRGDPACCLSTGCIDILSGAANPLDGLAGLPPMHPYHLVGRKGVEDACRLFKEIMAGGTGRSSPPSGHSRPPALSPKPWLHPSGAGTTMCT